MGDLPSKIDTGSTATMNAARQDKYYHRYLVRKIMLRVFVTIKRVLSKPPGAWRYKFRLHHSTAPAAAAAV